MLLQVVHTEKHVSAAQLLKMSVTSLRSFFTYNESINELLGIRVCLGTASDALPRMRKALELSLVGDASVANQRDCRGGCSFKLKLGVLPD